MSFTLAYLGAVLFKFIHDFVFAHSSTVAENVLGCKRAVGSPRTAQDRAEPEGTLHFLCSKHRFQFLGLDTLAIKLLTDGKCSAC